MSDENENEVNEDEVILGADEHSELVELANASEENASKADIAEQKAAALQVELDEANILADEAARLHTQLDEANARIKAGSGSKAPSIMKTPVKAVFIRDTRDYEVSAGDTGFKKGETVTFSSEDEYQRWHRRGACETPVDTAARVKAEQIKEDADKEAARG